jgi:hypothetical protein
MSNSPFEVRDEFNNTYSLPEIIVQSMDNAVPIWQVLKITKEQYDQQYGETAWTKKILQEQKEKEQQVVVPSGAAKEVREEVQG